MLHTLRMQRFITPFQQYCFKYYIRWKRADTALQAGEYAFSGAITPQQLLAKWVKGEVVLYSVTVPEGVTLRGFVSMLNRHPKITPMNISRWPSEEGLYYPDTYCFPANTSAELVLMRAKQKMEKQLARAWEARDTEITLTPYEALIVASIIEKETAYAPEKSVISGVLQRRLKKAMRLQTDPTVIYGLGDRYTGKLSKADLKMSTPFNTYVNYGLPPTPIALPSRSSIEAALHPDHSEYLYFVSKGDGTHHFSVTLKEHNEAVKRYQKG